MKIMFCLGGLNKGGAERVVCNLANFLVKEHEIHIVVTSLNKIEYDLDKNIKIYVLDTFNKKNNIIRNFLIFKSLYKYIKKIQPNVILGFLQEPTARLLFLKRYTQLVKNIPTIVSVRVDPKVAFNSLKRKISLYYYKFSDGFVFQTDEAKRFFCKKIQDKSIVIENSLDLSFFQNDNKIINSNKKEIVAVGRLTEQKNYPLLINAFLKFHNYNPSYKLKIYGDGPLKEYLINYVEGLQLSDCIKFEGVVNDIKNKISGAAMYVISSDYEGMSNSLMEALALGLPCISTNSSGGGASVLIKDGYNGCLIPVNDKEALFEKMKKISSDQNFAELISKNAIDSMKSFNPKVINKKWQEYIELIANRGDI